MRILALDAACGGCFAALFDGDVPIATRRADEARGQAVSLPPMVDLLLRDAGIAADRLDLVAVTVGPGSFTGLRAALSLAHGIALAGGAELVGVGVAEALRAAVPPGPRPVWVAIHSRRGHVFLDRDGTAEAVPLDGSPRPSGPVALAGNAAPDLAARLAAAGADVVLTEARQPDPRHVAAIGLRRLRGGLPALPAQPLYFDAPEAKPPAAGLRPAPA